MKTITKVAITVLLLIVAVSVLFTVLPAKEEMIKAESEDILTESQFREDFISGFADDEYYEAGLCTYERLYSKYGFEGFKEMVAEYLITDSFKTSDIDITADCIAKYPPVTMVDITTDETNPKKIKESFINTCGKTDPFCHCAYNQLAEWYGKEDFIYESVDVTGDFTDEAYTLISYCF